MTDPLFDQAEEALLRIDISGLANREVKQLIEHQILQAITPVTHHDGLVYNVTKVTLLRERRKRGVVVILNIMVETGKKDAMTPRFRQSRRFTHIR